MIFIISFVCFLCILFLIKNRFIIFLLKFSKSVCLILMLIFFVYLLLSFNMMKFICVLCYYGDLNFMFFNICNIENKILYY